jgi:hypothetical protein
MILSAQSDSTLDRQFVEADNGHRTLFQNRGITTTFFLSCTLVNKLVTSKVEP